MADVLNERFVLLGVAMNVVGGASYLLSTLRGRTQPNRVSWGLWALATLIAFAAELAQGVGLQSLLTFMIGFVPLLVFLASFVNPKAFWSVSRGDLACGAMSVLSLVLWAITRSGDIAIVFSIAADGLAALPTLIKAYRHPDTENFHVFALSSLSAIFTLATVHHWTFAIVGFPLYIAVADGLLTAIILRPQRSSGPSMNARTKPEGPAKAV